MRVAALYDVHAMPWALEAVLAEVEADAIVFGGDYLYGPCPRETVAIIRSLDAQVLRGNCEDLAEDWERERARGGGSRVAAVPAARGDCRRRSLLPCGSGRQHADHHRRDTRRSGPARRSPGYTGTIVIGHTHHQFDRRVGDLRIVNAGSVGMAYEGDVAAYWTLLDDGEPTPMRTPFDVDRAVRETSASGWPHAQEFVAENLLQAVAREEAIASLESRR